MKIPFRSAAQAEFLAFVIHQKLENERIWIHLPNMPDVLAHACGYDTWAEVIADAGPRPPVDADLRVARRAQMIERLTAAARHGNTDAVAKALDAVAAIPAAARAQRQALALSRHAPIPWQPQDPRTLTQIAEFPDGTLTLERPEFSTGRVTASFRPILPEGPRRNTRRNGLQFINWASGTSTPSYYQRRIGWFADRALAIAMIEAMLAATPTSKRPRQILMDQGFEPITTTKGQRYHRRTGPFIYEFHLGWDGLGLNLIDAATGASRELTAVLAMRFRKLDARGGEEKPQRVGYWPHRVGRLRIIASVMTAMVRWIDMNGYTLDVPAQRISRPRTLRTYAPQTHPREAQPFDLSRPELIGSRFGKLLALPDPGFYRDGCWWILKDGSPMTVEDYLAGQDGIGGYRVGDWYWGQERWAHRNPDDPRRITRVVYKDSRDADAHTLHPAATMNRADSRQTFRITGLSLRPALDHRPEDLRHYYENYKIFDLNIPQDQPDHVAMILSMRTERYGLNIVSGLQKIARENRGLPSREMLIEPRYQPYEIIRHPPGIEIVPALMSTGGWTKDVDPPRD